MKRYNGKSQSVTCRLIYLNLKSKFKLLKKKIKLKQWHKNKKTLSDLYKMHYPVLDKR